MNLFEAHAELDDRGKRLFQECIQELQGRSHILRGGAIRSDPKYAFLERHEELVTRYLEMGGWKLYLDRELGVARIYQPEGAGRAHFNKEETVLILVLRLLYHEHKELVSEQLDAVVSVGQVREKLHALLPQAAVRPYLSRKTMGTRLRRLERFRLLSFEATSHSVEDDTSLLLLPTLEHVVSMGSIEEMRARLSAFFAVTGMPEAERSEAVLPESEQEGEPS